MPQPRPRDAFLHEDHRDGTVNQGLLERPNQQPYSLSYIVELVYRPDGGLSKPLEVRHSIPASIVNHTGSDDGNPVYNAVSLDEAMVMPRQDISDELVRTFFNKLHPAYPVFDRQKFSQAYLSRRASPLVLQTIFLLGFTVGTDELIRAAGYKDRATARKTCYLRAKALYDADYEKDPMDLVASMLLLGFWWSDPDDQKGPCHWVGCATTFAQTLGLHRT